MVMMMKMVMQRWGEILPGLRSLSNTEAPDQNVNGSFTTTRQVETRQSKVLNRTGYLGLSSYAIFDFSFLDKLLESIRVSQL